VVGRAFLRLTSKLTSRVRLAAPATPTATPGTGITANGSGHPRVRNPQTTWSAGGSGKA
jgi:hypothetical protein